MLRFGFLALAFISGNAVLGGQIPVVGGILGGVPASPPSTEKRPQSLGMDRTPEKLRVVSSNSGICGKFVSFSKFSLQFAFSLQICVTSETTPGVFQASGYGDLTPTDSIWYVRDPQHSTKTYTLTIVYYPVLNLKVLVLCSSEKTKYCTFSPLV